MEFAARILVVDDDETEALLIKTCLERVGHTVTALTSSRRALDRIEHEPFDVVVTDFAMDELDGLALCARVHAVRPGTPIIMVTGHTTLQVAVGALRVGAWDFITKPLDPAELCSAVERAARKSAVRPVLERIAEEPSRVAPVGSLVGSSGAMKRVHALVARVGALPTTVMIRGETGTGKELVARALHQASGRSGAFVALNAAAVSQSLVESELFGHARGAFTDARAARDGLFVEAHRGTIFLDEISELPLPIQPKLLRALQTRTVRPVGSNNEIPFDARVVTATNRDLAQDVASERFREDLYYRLNVVEIELPPLRERGGDVLELATHFLARLEKRTGRRCELSVEAAEKLLAYGWPGNVRELENCIERAVALTQTDAIGVADLPRAVSAFRSSGSHVAVDDSAAVVPMAEVERRLIVRVLGIVGGNKVRAAEALGFDRRTFYRKLERFGISLDEGKPPRDS